MDWYDNPMPESTLSAQARDYEFGLRSVCMMIKNRVGGGGARGDFGVGDSLCLC